jgi:hypothetical protein
MNIAECLADPTATPTATPVPEPTPTPTAAFNTETISFAAARSVDENGYNWCDQPTRDTYTYLDDGIFQVGDSIPGAVPNSQKVRLVTAATGSAAAQVGKLFYFTEDEIMSIGDCINEPAPTPTATAVPDPTATPVPEPTPTATAMPVVKFYTNVAAGAGDDAADQPCEATNINIFTTSGTNGNALSLNVGDILYSDSGMTNEFDGGSLWYDLGDSADQVGELKFQYKKGDGILALADCPPATPTATPVPEPTPTPEPAEDPKTLYFWHGGASGHPYVADLTSADATYYITAEGASTTDLGVAFDAMMTNSPTPYDQESNYGAWPMIGSMTFGENETITNSSQQWDYFQTGGGYHGGRDLYYLVVPNNESFPEDMVANALAANTANNFPVQMASQKDFTWNGDNYTIYKLWPAGSNAGGTFKFLG